MPVVAWPIGQNLQALTPLLEGVRALEKGAWAMGHGDIR